MAPLERPRERIVLPFDRGCFARDALESTVAYLGVEHAPPGASRTRRGDDGSIALETVVAGRVCEVARSGFALERGGLRARVRHLLPEALALGALAGSDVSLDHTERLHGGRCTLDSRLRDATGRLVLWTHDGDLPEDRASHGLALRMRMADAGRGLAIAHRDGLSIVRGPGVATVASDEGLLTFVVLRTGDDDVAFAAFAC